MPNGCVEYNSPIAKSWRLSNSPMVERWNNCRWNMWIDRCRYCTFRTHNPRYGNEYHYEQMLLGLKTGVRELPNGRGLASGIDCNACYLFVISYQKANGVLPLFEVKSYREQHGLCLI